MASGDIEAGKAHVTAYMETSQLKSGLKSALSSFQDFGSKLAGIGARMTGIGEAIGLTMGKEFTGKLFSVVAGATLGAAIAAPFAVAIGKVFKSGPGAALIVELIKLQEQISVVIGSVADALVPPLTTALRIVTGIVSGTATWMSNHRQLVQTMTRIAGAVISIGAGMAVIGTLVEKSAIGFGEVAKVVAAVGAFLATPLGLTVAIGAAIVAGVAAWMRFTASGQAAAKMLLDYFAPAINFVKQLVGGIGDALMAGNLSLAGQIALKGLEIVFVEGLNTIADLIGGTLGDTLGEVASQISSGNLIGAWQTVITGMASLWANFSLGVVTVFTAAAKAVVDKWQAAVAAIAGGLLKMSAKGGVTGKIASLIVGADVGKLKEENDRIDAQRGIKQDVMGIGLSSIGDSTGAIAGPMKDFLDSVKAQAEATAEVADQELKTRVGRGGNRGDVGKLQGEFDALTKRAAKERAGLQEPELPSKSQLSQVAVGFSGAALALQLQGGASSPQKQLLDEAKKQRDRLDQAVDVLKKIKDKLTGFGITA